MSENVGSRKDVLRALAVVALLPLALRAAETTAGGSVAAKADAYMQARLKVGKFSGTVLVAKDGQPLFARGYGLANIEHDVPNTPQTKFRLASVSKQFTAAGIMLLEKDGKLKVDDPLKKHLPDCPAKWADVTLHQLMSHTSGVPENLTAAMLKGQWPVPVDLAHLYDIVKDRPLDFKPGEKWSYSNTGYALLGLVIEKLTGKPYGDFLKERVFDPLGMLDTGVDDRRLVLKHRANNYGMSRDRHVHAAYIDLSRVYSAGSLYSTAEDLLKWDTALYTEQVLPKKTLERMWTPVKNSYGYGWLIAKRNGRTMINHSGGLPGCVTFVLRYPEQKVFAAVLCNLEGSPAPKVAMDLAAIVLGDPYDVPVERKEVKLDPKLFDPYVGEYELAPKVTIAVTRRDDELYARIGEQTRFRLRPESPEKFFVTEAELTVAFARGPDGAVTELVLHEDGRDRKAKRLPPKPKEPEKPKDEKPKEPAKDKKPTPG